MVDFSQLVENPPPEKDPNIITGTITAQIEPAIKSRAPYERECQWAIGPYKTISGPDWVSLTITEGGVTGYEGFILLDKDGLNTFALDRIFINDPEGSWCANAGGGGWDKMTLSNVDLRNAIQQWLDREGSTYPFCQFCGEGQDDCTGGGMDMEEDIPAHDFAPGGISRKEIKAQ
jgi:hypothetical protein